MKYLFLLILVSGFAHSQSALENTEIVEVGSPKDCVALGKTDDQQREDDRQDLQQKILNCLGPKEEEMTENRDQKTAEVVAQ